MIARSLNFEPPRDILLDVSRLVWRAWERRLPTGIDRVCLAYLEHFRGSARAVVQRKGLRIVLSDRGSDRLFDLLLKGRGASRLDWARCWLTLLSESVKQQSITGKVYLNVGHTGLDNPSLPAWISNNRLRAVYLIHDLIPVTHPQFCRAGEADRHRQRLDHMLASASGIIGNSEATLIELAKYAETNRRRMPPTVAALIAGHQIPDHYSPARPGRPYFIAVGTIEARKNHMLLLQAWRRLVADHGEAAPLLVIAGQRGWEARPTLALLDDLGDLKGHVVEMGNCDDQQLADWISGARALLMPSFVEGFGLPIIEALQLSVPVIASDLPVYREIAGEIPTYLDPMDAKAWQAAVEGFLANGPERHRQIKAMQAYRAPTWDDHFGTIERWLPHIN